MMQARPDYTRTKWNGWGAPDKSFSLQERPSFYSYLSQKLGIYHAFPVPGLTLDEISLSLTRLTEAARSDLVAIVGRDSVKADIEARASHSVGKSYEDLVRARRGELSNPPDAVVFPGTAREVREVISWATENDVAIIPCGGGTSVVGGVEPSRTAGQELAVVIDLRRMDKILSVDSKSQTAKIEPGIRGPVLEECLQAQKLTLGHYPQSFEYSTLGGWIATRSTGQYSGLYGRIEDMVLGLSVETPVGTLDISTIPARAAGPEVREFLVGSEGCLGVITLAEMRLRRVPEARKTLAYFLPSFEDGSKAIRELVQEELPFAMVRLSDEDETETILALQRRASGFAEFLRRRLERTVLRRRGVNRPCLLFLGLQGSKGRVEQDARRVSGFMEMRDAYDLGEAPGRAFHSDRFLFPYLRDALMDIGVLVETFETSVSWTGLNRLYSNVRNALQRACQEFGTRSCINAQISHAYSSGASLCFTLLARVEQRQELRLWRACKVSATEAILRGGGRLSHHHGIGVVHREWMLQEHGPQAVVVLRSLKECLDPSGIMNPGKLLP